MEVEEASGVGCCSNDLVPDILVHLPIKTLLRFQLVCKQWKLLIFDVHFAVNHFRKTHITPDDFPTPSGLFLYHRSWQRRHESASLPLFENPASNVTPLSFLNKLPIKFPYRMRDIQSCNGLFLCIFSNRFSGLDPRTCCTVCNPTTRGFKVLPPPPDPGAYILFDGLTLVFDPFESHHYSVVAIKRSRYCLNSPELGDCKLYRYSSETMLWQFMRAIDGVELSACHKGVFLNGTVYWIGNKLMHYYNVNSQEVGSLDMPDASSVYSDSAYFAGGPAADANQFIISNSVLRKHFQTLAINNIGGFHSCDYVQTLVPV